MGAAYDTLAAAYDDHLTRDGWMRRVLWRHFDRLFRAGDHVLDVGCGTGADTIHLAEGGIRVTSVDVSSKMLDQLRAKLSRRPLASLVDIRQGDVNQLAPTLPRGLDGVVSSFAALNTVDLTAFGETAAGVLRPGGRLVCHMLSPGYLKGTIRRAWEGVRARSVSGHAEGETRIDLGGQAVDHLVLTPGQIYTRFFASRFVLRSCYAVGFLVPRSVELYLPAPLLRTAGTIESIVGGFPLLRSAGRFFVLDLARRA